MCSQGQHSKHFPSNAQSSCLAQGDHCSRLLQLWNWQNWNTFILKDTQRLCVLSIIQMKAFCFYPFTIIQINIFCIFSYYKEIVYFSFITSGGFMSSCALMEKPPQMWSHNVILTSSECSCSILETQQMKMCAGSGRKIQCWDLWVVGDCLQLLYYVVLRDCQYILFCCSCLTASPLLFGQFFSSLIDLH